MYGKTNTQRIEELFRDTVFTNQTDGRLTIHFKRVKFDGLALQALQPELAAYASTLLPTFSSEPGGLISQLGHRVDGKAWTLNPRIMEKFALLLVGAELGVCPLNHMDFPQGTFYLIAN